MTPLEAIQARHSVRRYLHQPLLSEIVSRLSEAVEECNRLGGLHIQLVTGETKAFSGLMAYGQFSGVENYFVMAGLKAPGLDERIGYHGERLVLLAQSLGLNTCWAGLSYRRVSGVYELAQGEKLTCMIALGYGETQGKPSKSKSVVDVSNADSYTPEWFLRGVEAALFAPTAINQQKFYFQYTGQSAEGKGRVLARRLFSPVGYTEMDLGIAKLHFEIGAGKDNFEWI